MCLAAVEGGRPAEGARRLHLHDNRRRAGLDAPSEDDSVTDLNITLVFKALTDDVPVGVRLRRLLKYALRAQRLKRVAAFGEPPEPTTATHQPTPDARPAGETG
jgi:hypothetical protein